MNNQTTSPVLFLIFNRPDTTREVFNQIKAAQPPRLYVAADGPRAHQPGEDLRCEETRTIIQEVDWPCEVKTRFLPLNLGCKEAVSSAISWFFEQEEEGIILEDDCLPSPSFFPYCDQLLKKYRFDTRIRHIAGSNHQLGKAWGEASYYFACQTHVWGWASWRRVWADYDKNLSAYQEPEALLRFDQLFDDQFVAHEWKEIFKGLKSGAIDTWDYQLAITSFFNYGLSINPNVNLISNIGFRADGTHTTSATSPYANLQLEEIGPLHHPTYVLPEMLADYAVFQRDFNLEARWKKHNLLRRRFKRWLKKTFKSA